MGPTSAVVAVGGAGALITGVAVGDRNTSLVGLMLILGAFFVPPLVYGTEEAARSLPRRRHR